MTLEVIDMANNDLAMRFTENVYATKQQVSRELKISMIDGVWDKILSYRSLFYRYLSIKGIDKNQYRVCLCPTVSSKLNEVENKLSRALNDYNKLSPVNSDLQHFRQLYFIKCLQNIGVSSMLISDEDRIKDVINGQSREPNSELDRYFSALQYIANKHVNNVDVDFLAELYSRLVGDSELTYFYREKDFEDINSSSVISRVYRSAPHVLIEQMMDGLFNFVENSNLSVVSKALIAYYYIRFVQPFSNYNREIAVLYAKAILAHYSLGTFIKCLQNIGVSSMLISDEDRIKDVINGQSREPNSELDRYFSALQYIANKHVNNVDVDFLAELYSRLVGDSELTYFYREKDFEDINSSSVISRVYRSAPHVLIEQMMDGLFNFVENSNLSVVSKALIAYYYIRFVQPFSNYNREIAVLYAKAILAHYSLGTFASFFPLETFLNENDVYVQKIFDEVQQTSDVTYFLTFALELVEKEAYKILDSLAEYSTQIIKNDFYRLDEEPKETYTIPVAEEKKPEPVPTPTPAPAPIKEVAPAPAVEEKKSAPAPIQTQPVGLAVSFIPEELDEKTAQRLERHLLELDVRLKKGQAYFYARHCTLGMFYTIEQYKKATKCVYETARTSMDKLVEYGYYEKQLVGKKFVYTPIKRK